MTDKKLVITDLDDTLWQWLTTWYAGHRGFIEYLRDTAGVPEDQTSEARARFYGDGGGIEFPPTPDYLIKYTDLTTKKAIAAYPEAVRVSRRSRDESLLMFDGVADTLRTLADSGVTVVAHTDSPITAAVHRLHTAGLDGAVKEVYAAPVFEDFGYGMNLLNTVDVHVSQWEFKPSTRVLNEIIRYHNASLENTFYKGRDTAPVLKPLPSPEKAKASKKEAPTPPPKMDYTDRDTVIKTVRGALKDRSGKTWSVRGGTGTAHGWITITAPPKRQVNGFLSDEDAKELHALLGISYRPAKGVRTQHITVPANSAYRQEFVDRAQGRTPSVEGKPYWD